VFIEGDFGTVEHQLYAAEIKAVLEIKRRCVLQNNGKRTIVGEVPADGLVPAIAVTGTAQITASERVGARQATLS
jgi:hypothetical protein